MTNFWQLLEALTENRIFDVLLGAIVAVGFAIFVEHLRKPKLTFSISPFSDYGRQVPTGNVVPVRSLKIAVTHRSLPWGLRWMLRGPASQCLGTITFHHLDGQNVLGRTMRGRWANTAEPVLPTMNNGQVVFILDFNKALAESRVDIFPGESAPLDIVARFNNEPDCYGWNNETYLHGDWKNPQWRLPAGRYLVETTVSSSGQKWSDVFRLVNDVPQQDFRLELATEEDKRRLLTFRSS
jgi:hypothetical protein